MTATLAKFKKSSKKTESAPAAPSKGADAFELPPGTPIAVPPAVLKALRKVKRKQLRVGLAECFLLLLAVVLGLWLAQGLADWWFNLPWGVRFFLFLADGGAAGFILFNFGWRPWRKRLNLNSAALLVEREIPAFRTSLISTVELAAGKNGTQGSLALVGELLARVNQQVQKMNLAKIVVKTARMKLFFRYAAIVLLIAIVAVFLSWPKPPILLRRIFLSTIPLPTRTVVVSISGNESVPIGSDLTLSARAEGEKPKSGRLLIVYADKSRQEITANSTLDAPDVFSVKLQNVQQSFQYRFILNDGTGPDFHVVAKVPPAMASFKSTHAYPAYTGLPVQEVAAGNMVLMAGGRVHIEGRATQALKSAKIQLEGTSQQVELKVGGQDGRDVEGEFAVPKEGLTGFSMPLVNSEGMASVENTVYRIELVQDKAPVVDLTNPSSPRLGVLTSSKPTLVYTVKDDFAVKKITLKYKLARPTAPDTRGAPEEMGEIALPLPQAGAPAVQTFVWDLASQKPAWTEGCNVTYWIEATDNNDVTGPGIGQSVKKTLAILTPEAKRAEILEMMGARAADIESVSNAQKKVNDDLDTTIRKNQ